LIKVIKIKLKKESHVTDDYQYNLYSPLPFNFPEKVHMVSTIEENKYIIPPLNIAKAKKERGKSENSPITQEYDKVKEKEFPLKEIGKKRNFETEEWLDILKLVNLTPEELDRLSKNKMLVKLIDAIELLNKVILERNMQIRLLNKENESLNQKNSTLNNDNIKLSRNFFEIKKHLTQKVSCHNEVRESYCDQVMQTNSSMVNNTSRQEDNKYNSKNLEKYYKGNYQRETVK
jgi:hypothetical protein